MGKKDIIINDVTRDTIVYGEYVYKSNKHGMFKINKKVLVKTETDSRYKYEVEFENTGFTRICNLKQIRIGQIKDELADDLVGKSFNSNKCGQFKVLRKDENKHDAYVVQFIDTNFIKDGVFRANIKTGKVFDNSLYKSSDNIVGKVYNSNSSGKFIVLEKTNKKSKSNNYYYKVKFIDTGYEHLSTKVHIINGELKDPFFPTYYGIGYLGMNPIGLNRGDRFYDVLYGRWKSMLSRCYNPLDKAYLNYGNKGIYVDKRWHCFASYFYDVQLLYGFDKEKIIAECTHLYQLDKDIICDYNNITPKYYSIDTCMWVDRSTNLDYRNYGDSILNQHNNITNYIQNINTEEVKPLIQIKPDKPDSIPLIRFLK